MNRFNLSLLSTLFVLPAAAGDPGFLEAVSKGKVSFDMRTRYEWVEDGSSLKPGTTDPKTANAFTNRLALAYRTLDWKGVHGFAQFENVASFGEERFRTLVNGKTQYAVVQDPSLTQVNQLYLGGYGLKVGRQALIFDNQRFVGNVGWRQNDQTFDGVSFTNKTWIPRTEFTLGHFTRVNGILGATWDKLAAPGKSAGGINKTIRFEVANAKVSLPTGITATAFYYASNDFLVPAGSWKHQGLRVNGAPANIIFDVSFVQQARYKEATEIGTKDADYTLFLLGYQFKNVALKVAQEKLEPGFKTPFATLHSWNGWADQFLATPSNGLVDTWGAVEAKLTWGLKLEAAYHRYKSDKDGYDYGREMNLVLSKAITKQFSVLLKLADYKGDTNAKNTGSLSKDIQKLWIQTILSF